MKRDALLCATDNTGVFVQIPPQPYLRHGRLLLRILVCHFLVEAEFCEVLHRIHKRLKSLRAHRHDKQKKMHLFFSHLGEIKWLKSTSEGFVWSSSQILCCQKDKKHNRVCKRHQIWVKTSKTSKGTHEMCQEGRAELKHNKNHQSDATTEQTQKKCCTTETFLMVKHENPHDT